MNFHISPLSPLRPRYPTSLSPSNARSPGPSEHQHKQHHYQQSDHDEIDGTDHLLLLPHAPPLPPQPPRTPVVVGRPPPPPLGRPRIEVHGGGGDKTLTSITSSSSGSDADHSSPSSDEDDSSDDDVTQDSRDVLVQRLNDLAQRLSATDVRAGAVGVLHSQVDDMERLLSTATIRRRTLGIIISSGSSGSDSGSNSNNDNNNHHRGHRRAREEARSKNRNPTAAAAAVRRGSSLQPGPRDGRSMVLSGGGGNNGDAHGRDALGLMGPPLSPSWLLSQFRRQPSISIHRDPQDDVDDDDDASGKVDNDNDNDNGRKDDGQDRTSELHKARPVIPPPSHLQQLLSTEQPGPVAVATTAGNSSSSRISYEMADTIVQEAEGLCAEMASVIESLQKRRQESDHIQAVLVDREGAADKLILEQAARIGELEDTVAEDESELRYLKIQLRGIEAQCMGYIPRGADPELDQSIRSWKRDWSSLRDRWATRRGSSFVSGDESSTFSNNSTSPAAL
ncbi:hypothetical protein VMCG_04339 [Cytospora schulzeri]|uniref:Uncharacterized protein n=1 Tax=Cytospora schulzeri TaxID=448051 RepID=A0A423WST2_9PEZI|nr:hypothetical protein VMCG_04339 [Valsa malicola]